MQKTFFTSDTHFFHKNIIKYENRPFDNVHEMNEQLIKNWNERVSLIDNVYILGDFSFGKPEETAEVLSRLNGNKYLIRGNHDYSRLVNHDLVQQHFVWIKDYYELRINGLSIALFHFPILIWDKQDYNSLHFYGHIHSGTHRGVAELKNAYNVGMDVNNLAPVELEEILCFIKDDRR